MSSKYFVIRSKLTNLVLDIQGGKPNPGTAVKPYNHHGGANQLWLVDPINHVIRSKLDESLVLDVSGGSLAVRKFIPGSNQQQWTRPYEQEGPIRSYHDANLVLDIAGAKREEGTQIIPYKFHGNANQIWKFEQLEDYGSGGGYGGQPGGVGYALPPSYGESQIGGYGPPIGGYAGPPSGGYGNAPGIGVTAPPGWGYGVAHRPRSTAFERAVAKAAFKEVKAAKGYVVLQAPVYCPPSGGYGPGKSFYIHTALSNLIMDVRGNDSSPGADVILYERKQGHSPNQLWYEDEQGVIRSKLNGFALDTSSGTLKLQPIDYFDRNRNWVKRGTAIANKSDPSMVIDVTKAERGTDAVLVPYKHHGGQNQQWHFEFI